MVDASTDIDLTPGWWNSEEVRLMEDNNQRSEPMVMAGGGCGVMSEIDREAKEAWQTIAGRKPKKKKANKDTYGNTNSGES